MSNATWVIFILRASVFVIFLAHSPPTSCETKLRIGRKNFIEQDILCEIISQRLTNSLHVAVEGCDVPLPNPAEAIANESIDLYVEYSGTAYTVILKNQWPLPPELIRVNETRASIRQTVNDTITKEYKARGLIWMPPLGFEDTFAIVVRREDAGRYGLRKISDLPRLINGREAAGSRRHKLPPPQFKLGSGPDFVVRPDGLRQLESTYGLIFDGRPRIIPVDRLFQPLEEGRVDVIAANSTDSQLQYDSHSVVRLEDDQQCFPPYDAAVVIREKITQQVPAIVSVLNELTGKISEGDIGEMTAEVSSGPKRAHQVAAEFLQRTLERGKP
jgi:osmoprotectant transport system substrate-binding protein